jgi:hypothetical protein
MVALRGQIEAKRRATGGEIFADDRRFRSVTTALFLAYATSGLSRRECALEFYDAFDHLLNGKPVDTLPAPSLDHEVRAELKALTAAD